MAQKPIIIYELKNSLLTNSDNFYAIGELNQFDSAILRRKYCGYGSFELWAPITAENKVFFTMPANNAQRFLYFGDNVAGFVECVQGEVDSTGKLRYHISGRTCEALLCFRAFGLARKSGSNTILTNTTTFSGLTAVQIIPKMLSDCYQGDWSANTTRRIPFLVAPTFSSNIPARTFDFQRSGGTLYDGIIDFLSQEILSLGFWVKFDPANRCLIPYVYAGVDRSTSQNANTSVIFSDQLNDILQSQYIFDTSNFCNVAYIFGEGEGSDRVFTQATRQTDTYNASCYTGTDNFPNFGLRELYVDARDVSRKSTGTITASSDTTTTLTDSQYFQALAKRGTQKLAEHNTLNTFNAVIRTEGKTMYKYGVDYVLGDIITIEDTRLGVSVNTRVTASEETFGSQYSLRLSFGEEPATLNDTLNSINNNFTN